MKKLFTAAQLKNADAFTIKNERIRSLDLMERASKAFVDAFTHKVANRKSAIAICCGLGNNGGDGLAIARLLAEKGYQNLIVYRILLASTQSDDNKANLKRLKKTDVKIIDITSPNAIEKLKADYLIDAIFGTGLNKPLNDHFMQLIEIINSKNIEVFAVDIPSGAYADGKIGDGAILKASQTFTFQVPKLSFLFPDSEKIHQCFEVLDISLAKDFLKSEPSNYYLTQAKDFRKMIKRRSNFSHKGIFGHALIVAGSELTMGAGLLATSACVNVGAGLTTANIPKNALATLNVSLPEAMVMLRESSLNIESLNKFNAICIGPGLGKDAGALKMLKMVVNCPVHAVIDADALTMLSENRTLLKKLKNAVITPHLKEFDRLFGQHENWFDRLQTAMQKAKELKVVIVLKNRYTFVCDVDGKVYVNPTGNPSMAQGGMGDALSGIITGLLAQGLSLIQAAIAGVYIHGKAGDLLAKKSSVVKATSLIAQLPKAIKKVTR